MNRKFGDLGIYMFEHIWWGGIAFIWYKSFLFRCFGTCSLRESMTLLLGLLVSFTILGLLLDRGKRRCGRSMFLNIMIAFGFYTSITYYHIKQNVIDHTIVFIITVYCFYAIAFIIVNIRSFRLSKKYLIRYFSRLINVLKDLSGIGMVIIIVLFGIGSFTGSSVISPAAKPVSNQEIEYQTIDNNMDYLVMLREDIWQNLTAEEKLNVLQKVADVERRYLGIPYALTVGTANLTGGALGYYSDRTREIIIDLDHLLDDSSNDLVNTICHEARHAYQHRLVDAYDQVDDELKGLLIFYDVSEYKEEFSDYTDASEDEYLYVTQRVEQDCRKYAKTTTNEYFDRINEYLRSVDHHYEDINGCQVYNG